MNEEPIGVFVLEVKRYEDTTNIKRSVHGNFTSIELYGALSLELDRLRDNLFTNTDKEDV